jgi:HK97 family phage prohead protease
MTIERRYIRNEFRVLDSDGTPKIVGHAAVFNSPSDPNLPWTESIDPHAFDAVLLSNPDVRALWNHNDDHILGRTKSGTLRLSTDDTGLRYEIDPPDTQVARDLMTSMKRGDVDQSSFGFIVGDDGDTWGQDTNGKPTRRIKSIRSLMDVSPVTFPAYSSASASVRSLPDSMPHEIRKLIEHRSDDEPTKKVDGEDLTADCFLIVLDPSKPDTWNLPFKFSTDEKTKSHLRDALARFDQLKDVPEADKDKAWKRLLALCKEHGIDVSKEDARSLDIDDTGSCTCTCPQCMAGACGICSSDPQCIAVMRDDDSQEWNSYLRKVELTLKILDAGIRF